MKDHMLVHDPTVQRWMNMTEEEVAAWREERRRNWPSEENIKRKAEERLQQQEEEKLLALQNRHVVAKAPEIRFKKPRIKENLLSDLFASERKIECDLLIQCFEYFKEQALADQ